MLVAGDRLSLPEGVELRGACLADHVRGAVWPLNPTGELVLSRSGRSLAEIADELAAELAVPADRSRADVMAFARRLNSLALANVECSEPAVRRLLGWARAVVRLAPAGVLPPAAARRRPLDTRTAAGAIGSCLAATAARAALLAAVAFGLVVHLTAVAGAPQLTAPLVRRARDRRRGCDSRVGPRGPPSRSAECARHPRAADLRSPRANDPSPGARCVSLAGPVAAAAVGMALVGLGISQATPELAFAGCPLCAHACGLTVLGGDGRVACGL